MRRRESFFFRPESPAPRRRSESGSSWLSLFRKKPERAALKGGCSPAAILYAAPLVQWPVVIMCRVPVPCFGERTAAFWVHVPRTCIDLCAAPREVDFHLRSLLPPKVSWFRMNRYFPQSDPCSKSRRGGSGNCCHAIGPEQFRRLPDYFDLVVGRCALQRRRLVSKSMILPPSTEWWKRGGGLRDQANKHSSFGLGSIGAGRSIISIDLYL